MPRGKRVEISDEELLEKLRQYKKEKGESPSKRDFAEFESMNFVRALRYRFGSWNEALKEVNLDTTISSRDEISKSKAIELHFGEGMTYEEIGQQLGCCYKTVQKILKEFPDIKNKHARKILYFGSIKKSEAGSIIKETKVRLGIVEEDDEYVFDPVFANDRKVRELADKGVLPVEE